MSKMKFIEEELFGCNPPYGTAQENYDGFIEEYGELLYGDQEITVEDIQDYFDYLNQLIFNRDKTG